MDILIILTVFFIFLTEDKYATVQGISGSSDSELLASISKDFYAWRLENWPEYGTKYNYDENNKEIDVYREEAFAFQKGNATEFLSRISVINSDNLSQQERFSKIILEDNLEVFINGYEYRVHSIYNSMAFVDHPMYEYGRMVGYMPKSSLDHFNDILDLFRAIPQQLTDRANLMRMAINQGITLHLFDVERGLNAMEIEVRGPLNSSYFYNVFSDENLPENITDKPGLQAEFQNVLENVLWPAFQNFSNFLRTEYWPNLRPDVGVGSLPKRQEFYQHCLRFHLGPNVSADDVHNMGLKEVNRIRVSIQQYLDENGFKGSIRDYIQFLRNQSEQYYDTSEAVLEAYREIIASAHDKLSTVLLKVPDIPIVPKYGMVALALHEAEPGHHTQCVYEREGEKPSFQTNIEFLRYNAIPFNWPFQTAFNEGWALYAEFLGEAMGAYENDPTTLVGRYLSEIFRAARLVVDTGMHSKGWTFEEAHAYLTNNTALSETSINNELKRYIGWPGQACAYKYGELKIRELRKRAEDHFGDEFDQKVFHDKVLSLSSAPLSLLEEQINTWLEQFPNKSDTASVHKPLKLSLLFVVMALNYKTI